MATLVLPDSRFGIPELFDKGRKPVGNVQVDRTNSIGKRLRYYSLPKSPDSTRDMVNHESFVTSNHTMVSGSQRFETNAYVDIDGIDLTGTHAFFAVITFLSNTSGKDRILDVNNPSRMILERNNTSGLRLFLLSGWNTSSINPPLNKPILIGYTHRVGDGSHVFSEREVEKVSSTQVTITPVDGALMAFNTGTSSNATAILHSWGIVDGGLSDVDILSLDDDPYQVLTSNESVSNLMFPDIVAGGNIVTPYYNTLLVGM